MNDWLSHVICAIAASWILLAGTVAFLRRGSRPSLHRIPTVRPTGQGFHALTRLLEATASSAYARDRVQARLQLLADDLHALQGKTQHTSAKHHPETDELLAAYFAEDHTGLRGGTRRSATQVPDFLTRTAKALQRLEHSRHEGDQP